MNLSMLVHVHCLSGAFIALRKGNKYLESSFTLGVFLTSFAFFQRISGINFQDEMSVVFFYVVIVGDLIDVLFAVFVLFVYHVKYFDHFLW